MRGCMHLQLDQKLDARAGWSILTCPTHPPNLYTQLKHTHPPSLPFVGQSVLPKSEGGTKKESKIPPKQSSVNQNEGWFKSDWVDCDDWQGWQANQTGSRVRGCGGSGEEWRVERVVVGVSSGCRLVGTLSLQRRSGSGACWSPTAYE